MYNHETMEDVTALVRILSYDTLEHMLADIEKAYDQEDVMYDGGQDDQFIQHVIAAVKTKLSLRDFFQSIKIS